MKTKIRNIGLLILALVMVLSFSLAFAACGGDDGGNVTGTVTFDLNYEGSESIKVNAIDGVVEVPDSPERSGYMFGGWYADAACTAEFDFSEEITKDTTVYAEWLERKEGCVYITYMYNYEGAGLYKTQEVESNSRPTLDTSCKRTDYRFMNWYTDAGCTEVYSVGRLTEDITLYALWYKGYTFEAEYTDLTDKNGDLRAFQGYSQNATPIYSNDSASNGYYIADMYINEAYIYFEIESDADVNDAVLAIRVAMDFGWGVDWGYDDGVVTISSDDYTLTVNGEQRSYTSIVMNGAANLGNVGDISPWQLVELGSISLQKGTNTIRFQVNNEIHGQGGTQAAVAPIFDYMMLYVPESVGLSWSPCTDNIEKYGVASMY